MSIREVGNPRPGDLFVAAAGWLKNTRAPFPRPGKKFLWTGSGKGAIALVLRYLRRQGTLTDRLSEVIVPEWIGYWVYNQIQEFAFPAKTLSARSRAILVYHQYGFPQDLDAILAYAKEHKLTVIEDCAHTLGGTYRGRPLGDFGDFSIYSFSKFFFCFALGGVLSSNEDFEAFGRDAISRSSCWTTFLKDTVKLAEEISLSRDLYPGKHLMALSSRMAYSLYSEALWPGKYATALAERKIEREIKKRKTFYNYFREQTEALGICDHLPKDDVIPYVIPIRVRPDQESSVIDRLKDAGISTGIYQFDIQRNMLQPRFERTIRIPCHGQLSMPRFERLTEIVKKTLR